MMKTISAFAVAAGFLMASPAFATVIQLAPTDDGDVQTFGGDDVNTTGDRLTATQSGGLERKAVMEFDLSSIPNAATINSASLIVELSLIHI